MAITLTPNAVKHVKQQLVQRGQGEGLRLGVRKSGCSGYAYKVEYADMIMPDDTIFEQDGLKIVVDGKSLTYLDGMEVDFQREGLNEIFQFNNPNVQDACGCGESVSFG